MQEGQSDAQQESFGLRQLMGAVNIGDFVRMVWGEFGMIASSARLAVESLPKLPFGPLAFVGGMFLAWLRLGLLFLVVVAFGSLILVTTVLRGLTKLAHKRTEDESPAETDSES